MFECVVAYVIVY